MSLYANRTTTSQLAAHHRADRIHLPTTIARPWTTDGGVLNTPSFAKIIQRCCYVNETPVKRTGGMILVRADPNYSGRKICPSATRSTNPTRTRPGDQDRKSTITYSENSSSLNSLPLNGNDCCRNSIAQYLRCKADRYSGELHFIVNEARSTTSHHTRLRSKSYLWTNSVQLIPSRFTYLRTKLTTSYYLRLGRQSCKIKICLHRVTCRAYLVL